MAISGDDLRHLPQSQNSSERKHKKKTATHSIVLCLGLLSIIMGLHLVNQSLHLKTSFMENDSIQRALEANHNLDVSTEQTIHNHPGFEVPRLLSTSSLQQEKSTKKKPTKNSIETSDQHVKKQKVEVGEETSVGAAVSKFRRQRQPSQIFEPKADNTGSAATITNIESEQHVHPETSLSNVKGELHPLLKWRDLVQNEQQLSSPSPPSPPPKVTVGVWPMIEFGLQSPEEIHIFRDGIEQSMYLQLLSNTSLPLGSSSLSNRSISPNWTNDNDNINNVVVWIGDSSMKLWGGKGNSRLFCKQFANFMVTKSTISSRQLSSPTFITDFSDPHTLTRCSKYDFDKPKRTEAIIDLFHHNIYFSSRSIVENRNWNRKADWVNTGKIVNLNVSTSTSSTTKKQKSRTRIVKDYFAPPFQHTPLIVRTDTVMALQQTLKETFNITNLASPIESILERPVDITHFWPPNREVEQYVGPVASNLRYKVSDIIAKMSHINQPLGKDTIDTSPAADKEAKNYNVFVDVVGWTGKGGRKHVKTEYVQRMLNTKILVLTQRDKWEDHYRLMEALISGAMVMTDKMLSLPHGLENGTSIVEYASAADLRQKLHYYLEHEEERLQIAKQGRYVAMSMHRSWHRVEGEKLLYAMHLLVHNLRYFKFSLSNRIFFSIIISEPKKLFLVD